MKDFGIFGIDSVSMYGRRLGWTTPAKTTTTSSPTPSPVALLDGTSFSVYFTYTFKSSDFPDKIDTIVETMYNNMVSSTPLSTTLPLFSSAKIKPAFFSFLGYFDMSTIKSTDDYNTESYGYYASMKSNTWDDPTWNEPTPESPTESTASKPPASTPTAPTPTESIPTESTPTSRKLRKSIESNASEYAKQKFLEFIQSRVNDNVDTFNEQSKVNNGLDTNIHDVERELAVSSAKARVDKRTGASCYMKAGNTFMYPVIKDFGVGGTSAIADGFNYTTLLLKGTKQKVRLDGTLFAKFPLECIQSKVKSSIKAEKDQYSDCQKIHINVAFVFYPGIAASSKSTMNTLTNGKIFQFGKSAFQNMITDKTNGDIATTSKAYNAMSSLPYAARFPDQRILQFPSLNLTQWNKGFDELCDGLCSMLVIELLSNNRLPSINKYFYKPKESPAFNDNLYREAALSNLRDSFPEPINEKYWQCTTSPANAFNQAIGVASAAATLYGTIGLTGICFLLVFYYLGKKNGPQFITIEKKEELDAYGKEVIHRKLLHSLNIIANELSNNNNGNSKGVEMLIENIKALDLASEGYVNVDEEKNDETGRKGLCTRLAAFAIESNG